MQLDPFADPVGGQLGRQVVIHAQRQRRVGAMHRGLVHPPADPPARGARADEGPHPGVRADPVDGVDDQLGAVVQPVDGGVGIVRRLAVAYVAGVELARRGGRR